MFDQSPLAIVFALVAIAIDASAGDVGVFTIQQPGRLSLTLFGSGFGSDTYSTTQAGFQLEQSITHYAARVGRVTAYQVYQGVGYNSPFVTEAVGTRTFERFQGGIDITPVRGIAGRFGWTRRRERRCAGDRRRFSSW